MLVLTRKLQEMLKIGDEITITVLKIKGNTVRLGIEAPRSVRVIRSELPRVADSEVVDVHGESRPPVADAVTDIAPQMLTPLEETELVQQPPRQARTSYNQRRPRFAMPEVPPAAQTVVPSLAK